MARARSKHDNASAVPVAEARRLLEELRKERQLPARGTTASADSMLDMLDEMINGGSIAFAANQLVKWARTFPTREDAEATHPWHDWDESRVTAIWESVAISGWTISHTASRYGTTYAIVDDIVTTRRRQIKRGNA